MADALLEVVLTELSSLIKEEFGVVIGFKKEFEKLSSTFSTIQSVLEDAEMKQLKDKALQNWLKKLNAAAYEVDDIVDECKTEAKRFKQSRVERFHPGIIPFHSKMGKRMKEMTEKLDSIAKEKTNFHLREGTAEKLNAFAGPETGNVLREKEVFGREKEENDIMKILLTQFSNSEELSVLPVVGMGGLGKTTLAQKIFNDERVTTHFKIKIWVCVSVDFDEKRLLKKIVECIKGSSAGVDDLAPLQTKVRELLTKQTYFLVLDDVWNEDQVKWANLRAVLNVGARGASVLVTTRGHTVGSIVRTSTTTYQLSNLSEDDCWLVFKECAAPGKEMEMDPNLVAIGKEIVKKCGGVPLAAKSLGSLLRFKREEREWENVRDNEIWDLEQDETSILPALRLSYHHLPLRLRQCFVYCAVFRKDTRMEKNNLIRLWMAHGFLSSKGKLEDAWNELYQRSFFQEVEVKVNAFGETYTYFKMHDLIHDLATLLMSTKSPNCKIRQIAVEMYRSEFISIDGFSKVISSYTPWLLKGYASLRVLNMRSLGLKELPSSIGDLIHLRLLDLSHNYFKTLPKRLCDLQNLETLNLEYCDSLSCLPKQISKLSSLRALLLYCCSRLNFMPPRIGELTCLKNLDYFVVGERKGSQLGELRNLDLHGLLCIKHLERVKKEMDAKDVNLSSKENLSSLSMHWDRRDECESGRGLDDKVLEALAPHPDLKFLEIERFRGSRIPKWMNGSVLRNVVKIEMNDCFINCVQLPAFGELPCLEDLSLSGGHANMEYVDDCGRFPSLKVLSISNIPNLKGLMKNEGKEHFPKLEDIDIQDCAEFVFQSLACVKKLKVRGNTTLSSISCLTTLTSLSIVGHVAASLPEDMFKSLAYLRELNIEYCQNLKELPTSLSALKILHISDCKELQSLPTTHFLSPSF